MNDSELKQSILELLEEPLAAEKCTVVDIVLSRYKRTNTVRLFVYSKKDKTLGECARLSRIAGSVIDETDWFQHGYTLEVSSPGLDRPLTEARDFEFRTGETVRVEFADKSRKKLTGKILSATDSDVTLQEKEQTIVVPLADIKQAKIVF